MILTILTYVVVTYIGVAALLAMLFGFSVWRLGGFQSFADYANKIGRRADDNKVTSTKVQWLMVLIVTCWPIIFVVAKDVKRIRSGS